MKNTPIVHRQPVGTAYTASAPVQQCIRFINSANAPCRQLETLEALDEAIEPLLLLIERHTDIDHGNPGPIGISFFKSHY